MLRIKVLKAKRLWNSIKTGFGINNNTVVIVLPENNSMWNEAALKYLPDYLKRKNADNAVVLTTENTFIEKMGSGEKSDIVSFHKISSESLKSLMDYYCLHRFFDKIVFFYLDYPQDNRSSFILNATEVTMDELVCLGFYRLREVPAHV